MKKAIFKYHGPVAGIIRFWVHKNRIKELYDDLLAQVNSTIMMDDVSTEEAINHVNDLNRNNEFGMYVFERNDCLAFGFRDMQMADWGHYELVAG